MPEKYDTLFARAAIHNKLFSAEQARALLVRVQPGQTLAQISIDAKLVARETAEKIIALLNEKQAAGHPPLAAPKGTSVRVQPPSAQAPAAPAKAGGAASVRTSGTSPGVKTSGTNPAAKKSETNPGKKGQTEVRKRSGTSVAVGDRKTTTKIEKKSSKLPLVIAVVLVLVGGGIGIFFATRKDGKKPTGPQTSQTGEPKKEEPKKEEPKKEEPKKEEPKKEEPKKEEPKKDPEREYMLQRLAEKRKVAGENLAGAKQRLETARAEERAKADAFRKRMSLHQVRIQLTSGLTHSSAVLQEFSFDSILVKTPGGEISIPWVLVNSETTVELAKLIFPDDLFERGRFLTSRKLWKEASDAFAEAARKDEDLQSKTEDILKVLKRLIEGQGTFSGNARRLGPDALLLTYDFSKKEQLGDFLGPAPKLENGVLELPEGRWRLSDLEYTHELEVEMRVKTSAKIGLAFHGCTLEIGTESVLKQKNKDVAKGTGFKADAEAKLRLSVRGAKVELYVDGKKALEAEVPMEGGQVAGIGPFFFGSRGGASKMMPPFTVRGAVDGNDLQKRFAEIEILVRRVTSGDLDAIQADIEKEKEDKVLGKRATYQIQDLSANDQYFVFRIPDLASYDALKERMIEFLNVGAYVGLLDELNQMIEKHPTVPSLHHFKGLYFRRFGDTDEAQKHFQKALEIFPDFYEAMAGLAEIHLYQFEFDEGLKLLSRAIELRPDYATAYALRATSRYSRDLKYDASTADDFDLAHELDPGDDRTVDFRRAVKTEARGPRDVGCIYEHETEHYRVITDIGDQAARDYGVRLEAAFQHFKEYAKDLYDGKYRRKPRVAIFNTSEAYYTYNELISTDRSTNTLGIFRRIYDELVLFEDTNLERSLVTLHHEQFHHFMSLITDKRIPYWYNEGIADYMGGTKIENGKVVKTGVVLPDELGGVRFLLATNYFFPFEDIMNQAPGEFYSGQVGLKYAQAWSMIHFFHHHEGGKYRSLNDRYLKLLVEGKSRREAYDAVFKDVAKDLEKEWKAYALKMKP